MKRYVIISFLCIGCSQSMVEEWETAEIFDAGEDHETEIFTTQASETDTGSETDDSTEETHSGEDVETEDLDTETVEMVEDGGDTYADDTESDSETTAPVFADCDAARNGELLALGVYVDRETCLGWQMDATVLDYYDISNDYCSKLDIGGLTWRLPTLVELRSIWQAGPNAETGCYWPAGFTGIFYCDGHLNQGTWSTTTEDKGAHVGTAHFRLPNDDANLGSSGTGSPYDDIYDDANVGLARCVSGPEWR